MIRVLTILLCVPLVIALLAGGFALAVYLMSAYNIALDLPVK